MRAPLPPVLPVSLPDYAPGRIHVVPFEQWPIHGELEPVGVSTTIPRYGLDVVTTPTPIDAARVRWLAEQVTTRTLDARHVHLVVHRGVLHVVDGHHALAAHLVTGSEQIPVRLFRVRAVEREGEPTDGLLET